jgi:transposase InsO family protein
VRKSQIFAVIARFSEKYPVRQMCDFYSVSRRGYYDHLKRQEAGNPDQELLDAIFECQKANKYRLGYRRVQKWLLREKGWCVDDKKVYRITSRNSLLSVIRRRKTLKYKPNGNLKYENLLNRKTHSDTPNTDWVTDISYIIMPDGTAYLSAIRDLCGQFIVAYKTARQQNYSLVKNTIAAAMQSEKPVAPPLLHSDGGGQYRSYDHKKVIAEYGLTPSMSKPATPGDNAMAENFFSIFKTECIYLEKPKTVDEAIALTDEFIHYYNYERIQGNGLTPYEARQLAFERQTQ